VPAAFKHVFVILQEDSFWHNVGVTFLRVAAGLLISSFAAVVLAILSSLSRSVERFFSPFLTTVKSIPTMSIIILALVWFKSGDVPVFVSFLICFPMLYSNTLTGIMSINPTLLEFCSVHHISFRTKLLDVSIPSVLPYFRSAFLVAIGFCWKATVAAEVLSAPKHSMGYELYLTKLYLNTEELFAWTIIIVGFTMLIEKLLVKVIEKQEPA
jgi:NitT/TauT family transport system permease protein